MVGIYFILELIPAELAALRVSTAVKKQKGFIRTETEGDESAKNVILISGLERTR